MKIEVTGNIADRDGSPDRFSYPGSGDCGRCVAESHLDADAWECRQIGNDCDRSDGSNRILQENENDQGTLNGDFGVSPLRVAARPSYRS